MASFFLSLFGFGSSSTNEDRQHADVEMGEEVDFESEAIKSNHINKEEQAAGPSVISQLKKLTRAEKDELLNLLTGDEDEKERRTSKRQRIEATPSYHVPQIDKKQIYENQQYINKQPPSPPKGIITSDKVIKKFLMRNTNTSSSNKTFVEQNNVEQRTAFSTLHQNNIEPLDYSNDQSFFQPSNSRDNNSKRFVDDRKMYSNGNKKEREKIQHVQTPFPPSSNRQSLKHPREESTKDGKTAEEDEPPITRRRISYMETPFSSNSRTPSASLSSAYSHKPRSNYTPVVSSSYSTRTQLSGSLRFSTQTSRRSTSQRYSYARPSKLLSSNRGMAINDVSNVNSNINNEVRRETSSFASASQSVAHQILKVIRKDNQENNTSIIEPKKVETKTAILSKANLFDYASNKQELSNNSVSFDSKPSPWPSSFASSNATTNSTSQFPVNKVETNNNNNNTKGLFTTDLLSKPQPPLKENTTVNEKKGGNNNKMESVKSKFVHVPPPIITTSDEKKGEAIIQRDISLERVKRKEESDFFPEIKQSLNVKDNNNIVEKKQDFSFGKTTDVKPSEDKNSEDALIFRLPFLEASENVEIDKIESFVFSQPKEIEIHE